MTDMFPRHEEFVGIVNATEADAFAHLDDQTRLSAHMSRRSWKMGWGRGTCGFRGMVVRLSWNAVELDNNLKSLPS